MCSLGFNREVSISSKVVSLRPNRGRWVQLGFALFLPNTQELMRRHSPGLDFDPAAVTARLEWRTTLAWGVAMAILAVAGVLSLSQATQFLYYQF